MTNSALHIHLDPVGGIAGDMFVAAMLDAWPQLAEGTLAAVHSADISSEIRVAHIPFNDGILSGSRFDVVGPIAPDTIGDRHHAPAADHDHGHEHAHIAWSDLRARLVDSTLDQAVKIRAVAIFELLARAEATVHATSPAAVTFHEVGAWDSVADIVAAAYIIEQLHPIGWSVGAIPLGGGRVRSAHGSLPVPAPATVLLLQGFAFFDDGHTGERVTPTGAAILRHLAPAQQFGHQPRRLMRVGYGFGTRRFEGMSNVLRLIAFEEVRVCFTGQEQIGVMRFEVDDQTAEDLAVGLENLRELPGVIDITQASVIGKQGRLTSSIQVLAAPDQLEVVANECFNQTTTIGVRTHLEERFALRRQETTTDKGLRVKVVRRPTGMTAKTDIAEVAAAPGGHAERLRRRFEAEQIILSGAHDDA